MNKSKGHQFFAGNYEYFLGPTGDLYRAPATNYIEVSGYRSGARFEASPASIPLLKKLLVAERLLFDN